MRPSDIERTACERVPGAGAVTVERLVSGLVNESFLVMRDGRRYALRVPAPDAASLGIDRGWECRVLALAAAQGIAPRVECCEPGEGLLVTDWVRGRRWTVAEAGLGTNLEKMARLMRRVHAMANPGAPRVMGPQDWIAHYREALARRGADATRAPGPAAQGRLADLAALPPAPPVLCHSDLHVQNLLECDRGLVLLDWEYAHVSEAFWDLAAWSCNNDFRADCSRSLLTCYLGRTPREEDELRLSHLRWLYDCVCLLWIQLYLCARSGGDRGGLASRAAFLAARLDRS